MEKLVKENMEKIDELNKKHNEEVKALNKKHDEEIKALKEKISKEIETNKEEDKIINETSEETLVDALCAVFENAGKKDEYMKLYESSKNFNTDIINLILTNNLSDLSLAILNDRLNDKDAKEIKDNLLNKIKINETKEKESKSKDNECVSDETNIERLIKAADIMKKELIKDDPDMEDEFTSTMCFSVTSVKSMIQSKLKDVDRQIEAYKDKVLESIDTTIDYPNYQ